MAIPFLHELKDFPALLRIIEEETGIDAYLVEKDYWLMHVLYGLKAQGYEFNLKGGTSLSKGYKIIHRFSEDIDIYIRPHPELAINEKSQKPAHVAKRKTYYDSLAQEINIPGIISVVRDTEFDDEDYYRSGGIRLHYESHTSRLEGVKEGILLEAGFDTVMPFEQLNISSWAFDKASASKVTIADNRATNINCYHPGYTFVEKLQTIATKYRKERDTGKPNPNFMRQYYDLYCLLEHPLVLDFIGTQDYEQHKQKRFPKTDRDIPIAENEAFLLSDPDIRKTFTERYSATSKLYYKGQPHFDEVLGPIHKYLDRL
jgi:hypothetical protein